MLVLFSETRFLRRSLQLWHCIWIMCCWRWTMVNSLMNARNWRRTWSLQLNGESGKHAWTEESNSAEGATSNFLTSRWRWMMMTASTTWRHAGWAVRSWGREIELWQLMSCVHSVASLANRNGMHELLVMICSLLFASWLANWRVRQLVTWQKLQNSAEQFNKSIKAERWFSSWY